MSPKTAEAATLSFGFTIPIHAINNWELCGFTSNFIANYQSMGFQNSKKLAVILSTIINELMENAIKFSPYKDKSIAIQIQQFSAYIDIETTNITDKKTAQKLETYIQTINQTDTSLLFYKKLEATATTNNDESGIGLLSLINHHNAKISLNITPSGKACEVKVKTRLTLTEDS